MASSFLNIHFESISPKFEKKKKTAKNPQNWAKIKLRGQLLSYNSNNLSHIQIKTELQNFQTFILSLSVKKNSKIQKNPQIWAKIKLEGH